MPKRGSGRGRGGEGVSHGRRGTNLLSLAVALLAMVVCGGVRSEPDPGVIT